MYVFIFLLFAHLLGDSAFLWPKLRKQKIESVWYLLKHVGIYTLVLLICCLLFLHLSFQQAILYSLINGVLHFIFDYVMTKIKLKYWKTDVYAGVLIFSGLEHVIHVSILLVTFYYLFPEISQFGEYIEMFRHLFAWNKVGWLVNLVSKVAWKGFKQKRHIIVSFFFDIFLSA